MTTWTTTLKFAPLLTVERVNDPAWQRADRHMYAGLGALRFLPRQSTVPLLVDHDPDHEIGRVTDLWRLESLDGPWIAGSATLHEPPGRWLTRGRRVSFGSKPYGRRAATFASPEGQVVTHAFLEEISVLVALKPAEPLAEVVLVREAEPAARRHHAEPEGEIIYGGAVIVRRAIGEVLRVR